MALNKISREGRRRKKASDRRRKTPWTRSVFRRHMFEPLESREMMTVFAVTSFADTPDACPGDGFAADVDGNATLRAAVMEANAKSGNDTINLPAGNYQLSIARDDINDEATGDLDITSDITIVGAGADLTTIDANGLDRVLELVFNSEARLYLQGLTVTGGNTSGATDQYGGGILNDGGSLTLNSVHLTRNFGESLGGGLLNAHDGQSIIVDSAVTENWAGYSGGGIDNYSGSLVIENSTVSGNRGARNSGIVGAGSLSMSHVTVVDNVASEASDPDVYHRYASDFQMQNSLVGSLKGAVESGGHNLVINSEGSSGLVDSDLVAVDARLGPLADNGGSTPTHALLAGSPAIDAGSSDGALATDQRGMPRPLNGGPTGGDQVDIGAFEVENLAPLAVDDVYQVDRDGTLAIPSEFTRSQEFQSDPGWTSSGNGEAGNSFGYQDGRIGGRFTRSSFARHYGDLELDAPVNFNQPFSASGIFEATDINHPDFGNGMTFGHFTVGGPDEGVKNGPFTVGIGLTDNSRGNELWWYGGVLDNSGLVMPATGHVVLELDQQHSWSYSWDPQGGESYHGSLTVTLDGVASVMELTAEQRAMLTTPMNAFGLSGNAASYPSSGQFAEFFIDDVSYTSGHQQGILANDSDPDGDLLASLLVEGPEHGTVELNSDGSFRYQPEIGYHGDDSFTYVAHDGHAESNVATVTIDVLCTNQEPVAVDDGYLVDRDGNLLVRPLTTTTELFGSDPGWMSSGSGVGGNDFGYHADGRIGGRFSRAGFARMIADTSLDGLTLDQSISASGTLSVTGSNRPDFHGPMYLGHFDVANMSLDGLALGISFTNNNSASGPLYWRAGISGPDGGLPLVAPLDQELDWSYDWDPVGGEYEAGRLTVQLGEETQQLDLTAEQRASFADTSLSGFGFMGVDQQGSWSQADWYAELYIHDVAYSSGQQAGLLANDYDPDGDSISARLVEPPEHGTLQLGQDGHFTYRPDPDFQGTDFFTYVANDGQLESNLATVTIDVFCNDGSATVPSPEEEDVMAPISEDYTDDVDNGGVEIEVDTDLPTLIVPDDGLDDEEESNETLLDVPELIEQVGSPAIDDTYTSISLDDGPSFSLDVMANDRLALDEGLWLVSVDEPGHGTATMDLLGGVIVYQPEEGFVGTDQFHYVVSDIDGVTHRATVTVQVQPTADDNDLVRFSMETVDIDSGEPISEIEVGESFELRVYVEDIRTESVQQAAGVFAAYLDLLYPASLVQLANSPAAIQFSDSYANVHSGDIRTSGIIDELGAMQSGLAPLGGDRVELVRVTFDTIFVGTAMMVADPADQSPAHSTLIFHPPQEIMVDQLHFTQTALEILEPDPTRHLDVNGDGAISPMDALQIVNDLNYNGPGPVEMPAVASGAEGESIAAGRKFLDVNRDHYVSPMDALAVINHLNQASGLLLGDDIEIGEGEAFVSMEAGQPATAGLSLTRLESITGQSRLVSVVDTSEVVDVINQDGHFQADEGNSVDLRQGLSSDHSRDQMIDSLFAEFDGIDVDGELISELAADIDGAWLR